MKEKLIRALEESRVALDKLTFENLHDEDVFEEAYDDAIKLLGTSTCFMNAECNLELTLKLNRIYRDTLLGTIDVVLEELKKPTLCEASAEED